MSIEELKYPVGKYQRQENISPEELKNYINEISNFPARLKAAVQNLSEEQLDTPYREDGWTVRQVVHHCADSHMNSLTRLKLALTEDVPVIKPYVEAKWAELADSKTMDIFPSLQMIEGIHQRWTVLLHSLTPEEWQRTFIHPQTGRTFRLDENSGLYAWHCRHHLAHITGLIKRMGW
ncbi:MAG: bacillithiol transferase BstA [Saprospiraceae bacterium]|nr:bacillithiol transferase BstA [Saprospiraceae bacterium]MBK6567105.1 bacillithiol transferase BstA [Saprospiraceae bacterium]MBK6785233.1 bacillithiol transferase BstA [Saprospiraceae bacterium]MBK7524786.1 bacillithiol transferase BstA [Saprospiraceae bacterium]MBK8081476.1 bacillithiol transferase BstA [Saprospiraceae bacterium]